MLKKVKADFNGLLEKIADYVECSVDELPNDLLYVRNGVSVDGTECEKFICALDSALEPKGNQYDETLDYPINGLTTEEIYAVGDPSIFNGSYGTIAYMYNGVRFATYWFDNGGNYRYEWSNNTKKEINDIIRTWKDIEKEWECSK